MIITRKIELNIKNSKLIKIFGCIDYTESIIIVLLICLFFLIGFYLYKKIFKKHINKRVKDNIQIIFLPFLIFIYGGILFFPFIQNEERKNILSYIFSILLLTFTSIITIKQKIENNKLSKKYDKLLKFMTTYEEEIEKQRILRHETKNEFLNIKAQLIDNQQKDKIIEYINNILNDKIKVKFEEYAKFQYLPPNGIKGLCYFKVSKAQSKGVEVDINISSQIRESNIYHLDLKEQRLLVKILGVFLDNAIEASSICKEKKMGIEAYSRNQEFKMIISNTYVNEIDINKIGKEKFTSKGKNRGHGLLLVKSIVKNHPIFEINSEVRNKLYIQYIKIKK